jgi:hypothetical protein
MRPTGQPTSPYGIQVINGYLLGFGECPEELMVWATRMDWISDSIEAGWNRRKTSEAERADKARRGVNKESVVSSADKRACGWRRKRNRCSAPSLGFGRVTRKARARNLEDLRLSREGRM